MHPVLTHQQATELADQLKNHLFHETTIENQWHKTNGGYQYYLWYAEALGPSPTAIRIEELLHLMYRWNLDWYIRQVWSEWNRRYAPDAKKDAKRRVILDYREECLRHGRTQQLKATQEAAAQREQQREFAEHGTYRGIEFIIIRSRCAVDLDNRKTRPTSTYKPTKQSGLELLGTPADRGGCPEVLKSADRASVTSAGIGA